MYTEHAVTYIRVRSNSKAEAPKPDIMHGSLCYWAILIFIDARLPT